MGSCASARRNSGSSGKYRQSLVHFETDKHTNSMPSTPVKEKLANLVLVDQTINSHVYRSQVSPLNSVTSFSNNGSKDEAFFDSQAWFESDDEFYSVNGDFTPSRGNTPLHGSVVGTPGNRTLSPQVNRALFGGRAPSYNEPNRSSRGSTPLHRSVSAASPQADLNRVDIQKLGGSATNSPQPEKKRRKKLAELFRESIRESREDELDDHIESDMKFESSQQKSANATPQIVGRSAPADSKPSEKEKHFKYAQCCFPRLHSSRGLKKPLVAAPAIAVDA